VLLTTLALGLGLGVASPALGEPTPAPRPAGPEVSPVRGALPAGRSEESLAVKGIYLQKSTVLDGKRLQDLIEGAKLAGFNTFVVDIKGRSPEYAAAIKTIQDAGLRFVPRVTMFPGGASREQMADRGLLERRWAVVNYALELGAKDIQLDYIRFSSRNTPSDENSSKVREVLRTIGQRVHERGARLQIDVFGEVSYGPSLRIGQDMRVFAPELDAVCPMLYPSHFEPYKETAKKPYETVHGALVAMARQIQAHPIPMYPYIEHFNYRHRMSADERAAYFEAQLEAVLRSDAQGFYLWSVGNYYEIPFSVLARRAQERRAAGPLAGGPTTSGGVARSSDATVD